MIHPGKGILLLAAASLPDPNFDHTVVLLCEHDDAAGSFGLVLNHRTQLSMSQVFDGITSWNAPLFRGGPVQLNTLHFIHQGCDADPEAVKLADGIYWGRDFVAIRQALNEGAIQPDSLRFFAGYSGWGEQQLAGELKQDSWHLARATRDLVFADDSRNQWRNAFRTLGPNYAVLANFPDDCMLN